MAAYYKVDVVLNSQAVQVGMPSPQSVLVTLPNRGPQGVQGLQGEVGPIGPVGETGSPGADGREVELQTTETHVQWRYEGETEWTDLVALSAITGPQGIQGETGLTGSAGADGREVELRKTETHVQWRYEDEAEWTDLIALTEITGPQGQTGNQGPAGPANTLAIGTVTTGAAGSSADATLTGDSPAQTLNLVIPRGDKGDQGDQGPAGTATTDAADLTTGTLADARLSSNVPLKDAANTFSANQTLDGTNNVAPNQTAASGSSIMTRALVDSKLLLREFPLHPKSVSFFTYPVTTTASASGGGGGAAGSGYRASSSTTNGSRGVVRLAAAASQLQPIFTLLDWSKPIIFGAKLSNVEVDFEPDKVQRIIWGASIGYTHDDPTNLCVGFRFENGTVFGFCHDGTTYTEPVSESTILPALRAVAQRSYYSVFITSDGAGNIEWFVDGASIGTSSAGPSTVSGTNQSDIAIQAQSNATLTSQNLMPAGYFYIAQP